MAKDEILYTTTSKQLEKLKSQNLIIENEERAYKRLQSYGYFNIIKGYRNPYIFKSQLPSRTNGLHLRPLIPDRYCYLKWRYIIGWLTAPFVAEFTLLQLY